MPAILVKQGVDSANARRAAGEGVTKADNPCSAERGRIREKPKREARETRAKFSAGGFGEDREGERDDIPDRFHLRAWGQVLVENDHGSAVR